MEDSLIAYFVLKENGYIVVNANADYNINRKRKKRNNYLLFI